MKPYIIIILSLISIVNGQAQQNGQKPDKAVEKLKDNNVSIISIEQVEGAIPLQEFEVESGQKYALVFGNEVKGVQQDIINQSDYCLEIPQFGTKHSLNISVSAGVVLWEFVKKTKLL